MGGLGVYGYALVALVCGVDAEYGEAGGVLVYGCKVCCAAVSAYDDAGEYALSAGYADE